MNATDQILEMGIFEELMAKVQMGVGDERPADVTIHHCGRTLIVSFYHDGTPMTIEEIIN
jgi:hypothetical protein